MDDKDDDKRIEQICCPPLDDTVFSILTFLKCVLLINFFDISLIL